MKGKFITLFLGLLLLLSLNANAQNGGNIYGPTQVQPGSTEYYSASFSGPLSPYTNISWTAYGGTVVSYSSDPYGSLYCYVQWDNNNGEGWVDIYEDVGGQWGVLTVLRGISFLPGNTWTSNEYFNHLSPVTISQNPASGGGGCTFDYTWEFSINNGISWVPFASGQNYPGGAPQNYERLWIRRAAECNGQYEYTDPLEFRYRSVSWDNRNFISTNEIWYAGKSDFVSADNIPVGQKQQNVVYYDGLGRNEQAVVVGASPETGNPNTSKKDLVTHVAYDALGREEFKYLAYPATTADGKFKTNALSAQQTYMAAKYPGEAQFYAETDFESSPLNRPLKTKAPGLNFGQANVGITTSYNLNTTGDEVRIWNIDAFTAGAIPTSTAAYPAYTLSKTTITDERGKQIVEYRDREGRVILKKQQLLDGGSLTAGHSGWLCTYYVYDDWGRMRFMISPKAVDQLPGAGWTISTAMAEGLCYSYTFDKKGRLIEKRAPDSKTTFMVYDNRDRLVFSQDGTQKEGKTNTSNLSEWTFFLYDGQNRPVATGVMRENAGAKYTRTALQALVDNPANVQGEKTFNVQTDVTESISALNPVPVFSANGTIIDHHSILINTINYHDGQTANQYVSETLGYANNFENVDAPTPSNRTRGLQTGTKARAMDGTANKFLASHTVYDEKGRVLQSNMSNYLGHSVRITNQYDFAGKTRSSLYKEVKTTTISTSPVYHYKTNTYTILSKYEQDHVGRLKQIKKNVTHSFYTTQATDAPNPLVTTTGERTVVEHKYDELGQLVTKTLAPGYSGPNGAYLEKLDYEYNIRGWMTGINKNYVSSPSPDGSFFGMELGYDKAGNAAFANPLMNGNVAGIAWKTAGDNTPRKFDYTYDNANRLTVATFKQRDDFATANNWANTTFNFSVPVIQYDFNGNITRMEQMGVNFTGIVPMDKMTYGYDANTNKLNWVAEDVNTDYKMNDFTDKNAGTNNVDYLYDENGNLIQDKNKGITSIRYNYLNLPEEVVFDNNRGNIRFIYDAAGNKLQKIVTDNTVTPQAVTTTSYSGPIVYTGNDLYITFEEGRVRYAKTVDNDPPAFTFDYMIKDHLNNVRMVLTEDAQDDVYPAATLEDATYPVEINYYKVFNRSDRPVELTGAPEIARYGQKMSKVTTLAGGNKIGMSLFLKVMAGDIIDASTDYYFKDLGTQVNTTSLLNDLASNLLIYINGAQAGHTAKAQSSVINNNVLADGVVGNLITTQNSSYNANKPKSHLNYIVFDEQFKAVKKGFLQVQNNGALQVPLVIPDIEIEENGWILVFVNNESEQPVYYDNFQVTHKRGNIMEETHYYPFGLTMKAISPRAIITTPVNRHKYNGKELQNEEFSDGSGLEGYDYSSRIYDPQIGRWFSQDELAEDFPNVSPYAYAVNNPVIFIDKDGKFVQYIIKYGINVGINVAVQMLTAYMFDPSVRSWGDAWDKVSMWDALWESASDMIGSKALRMAGDAVKGMFNYIDQVGLSNVTGSGLLQSGLMGILEPMIGNRIAKGGFKAVKHGLARLGVSPSDISKYLFKFTRNKITTYAPSMVDRNGKPKVFKTFNSSNYRDNLATYSTNGVDPGSMFQAHHAFPQAFEDVFKNKWGLNINNPQLMQWWSKETHQLFANEYNEAWRDWISKNQNATITDVLNFGRKMMDDYGLTRNF